MIKSRREAAIKAKVCAKLRARFTQIFPVAKQGLFNFRCFENAVQFATDSEKPLRVLEVMYIDGDYPVMHYIVQDGDECQEVTLGWRTEHLEYYLIREVPKGDWKFIGSIFESSSDYWYREFTTWFDRAVLRIDRVC